MFLQRIDRRYYVYAHYSPFCSAPFYIGKGTGGRAWTNNKRNDEWYEAAKGGFYTEVLQYGMPEPCAFTFEKIMIHCFEFAMGKGFLANRTIGGEGSTGHTQSDEVREAKRLASEGANSPRYGMPPPAHVIEAARKSRLGVKQSPETLAKRSAAQKGKNHSQLDMRNHKFAHPDGREFTGLQFDFAKKYELRRPKVCNLIQGKRQSHFGWRYCGEI